MGSVSLSAQIAIVDFDFKNNLTDGQSLVTDLTTVGTTSYVAGKTSNPNNGQAYSFDGIGNHLNSPTYTGVTGTGARTIMTWINVSTADYTSGMTICDWGTGTANDVTGWTLKLMTYGSKPSIRFDAGGNKARASLKDTQIPTILDGWHHIAMTFPAGGSSADILFYVDGVVISGPYGGVSTSASPNSATTAGSFRIGSRISNTNKFKGEMDDFRIYNVELTASQVLTASGIITSTPVTVFNASTVAPTVGEIVTFTDSSANNPSTWLWDFGDATATGDRTAQSPKMAFNTAGTYTVTLTTSNAGGSDSEVKTSYITVSTGVGSGDLQMRYNFTGDITDASSYNRDLVAQGALVPTYGNRLGTNDAYTTSGVYADHLITSYPGVSGSGARTVTAWYKTSGTSREPIISWGVNSTGQMFNVMIDDGVPRIEGGTSNLQTSDTGLNDNTWRHIAVTFDSADGGKLSHSKIYLDGVLSTNESDTGLSYLSESTVINTSTTTNFLKIASAVYGISAFDGVIDDVRIYNRALTSDEITSVMGGGILDVENVNLLPDNIRVFPSIVSDILRINSTEKELVISIYNLTGVLVNTTLSSQKNTEINMDSFSSGIYVVKVKYGRKSLIVKIVKN